MSRIFASDHGWGLLAVGVVCLVATAPGGTIIGWGDDAQGEVTNIPPGDDFTAIAAGGLQAYALRADGSLVAWGLYWHGELDVPYGYDFVAVTGGAFHGLALKQDGSIVGWGFNGAGQATPPAGNDFAKIAAGGAQSLAIRTDGSLAAWGAVTDAPAGHDFVAISCQLALGTTKKLSQKPHAAICVRRRNQSSAHASLSSPR